MEKLTEKDDNSDYIYKILVKETIKLKDEEFALLEFLKTNCGKEYKLFSLNVFFDKAIDEKTLSVEKVEEVLKSLDEKGYIEIKYFSKDEVLVKPLPLGFSVVKTTQKPQILQLPQQTVLSRKEKIKLFGLCFLGGLTGSLFCFILQVFLC